MHAALVKMFKAVGQFRCQGCVNARPWSACFESLLISKQISLAIFSVEKPRYERSRAAPAVLCSAVPLGSCTVCYLVFVCAYRAVGRGGALGQNLVALLDEAGSRDGGAHRRNRIYVSEQVFTKCYYNISIFIQVHTVQAVLKLVREVEGKKQVNSKWHTTTRNLDAFNLLLEYFWYKTAMRQENKQRSKRTRRWILIALNNRQAPL